MAHIHGVYDSDAHFSIDPATRALKCETATKPAAVQYDHNAERLTFEVPRYVEEHDMKLCNVVQVHYINIDTTTKEKRTGVYPVTDLQVAPDDENLVLCSWLISRNATQLVGTLAFIVRFSCTDENGSEVYGWSTAKNTGVYVTEGIYNGDAIVEEYADILTEWEARIQALEKGPAVTDEQVAKALADYLAEHPISAGSSATIGTVNLPAANWTGGENLYSQVVSIAGVTENSQVDLTPSVEQLVVFYEKDLTLVAENEGGTVTVYAIGQKPENDYAIQVTITEVQV